MWALTNSNHTMSIISHPKPNPSSLYGPGSLYNFSPCGTLFAVVHRIELQDHIAIFAVRASGMEEVIKFKARSSDIGQ